MIVIKFFVKVILKHYCLLRKNFETYSFEHMISLEYSINFIIIFSNFIVLCSH
jgi:hypothetical protein